VIGKDADNDGEHDGGSEKGGEATIGLSGGHRLSCQDRAAGESSAMERMSWKTAPAALGRSELEK
jgi:hypothetical protein